MKRSELAGGNPPGERASLLGAGADLRHHILTLSFTVSYGLALGRLSASGLSSFRMAAAGKISRPQANQNQTRASSATVGSAKTKNAGNAGEKCDLAQFKIPDC
jgi:hypothetical protein